MMSYYVNYTVISESSDTVLGPTIFHPIIIYGTSILGLGYVSQRTVKDYGLNTLDQQIHDKNSRVNFYNNISIKICEHIRNN